MTDFTIKQKLRDLLSRVEGLSCKVCLIDDELVLVDGRVTVIEGDITTIEGDVSDHETRITALEGAPAGGTTINLAANYAALPDPTTVSGEFYYVEAASGTAWLPGTLGGTYRKAGLYYSNGVAWLVDVNPWEASQADVDAGVITDEFVSPATLSLATTVSHPGHTHVIADITDYTGTSASVISPAQITSDQDNYNPTGFLTSTVVRLSGDNGLRAITGLAAGTDGQIITLMNVGSYMIYFPQDHPDSSAANRFTGNGSDYKLYPGKSCKVLYDLTSTKWRIIGEIVEFGKSQSYYAGGTQSGTAGDHNELGFVNGGAITLNGGNASWPSSLGMSTSTSPTGNVVLYFPKGSNTYTQYGTSHIWLESFVSLSTLSDGTESYTAMASITTSPNSATLDVNNSIGIRYSHGLNSGKWQGFSRNNVGAETLIDLGVTVVAGTTYTLRIELDKGNTEARFYINGAYIGRIAATMPTANACGARLLILKSLGATAREMRMHNFSAGAIYP
jgi:hypothetical protein